MRTPHTPGPWRPHIDLDHYDSRMHSIRVRAVELEEHPQGPLTVAILNQNLDDEAIANALLIAAAPEMLDTLRLALACLDAAADGRLEDVKDEIGGTANMVDAIIAKATTGDLDQ